MLFRQLMAMQAIEYHLFRLCLGLQAKISHKDETRVIHLANQITYAELLDTVKQKFPNAWPFQLKYLDR